MFRQAFLPSDVKVMQMNICPEQSDRKVLETDNHLVSLLVSPPRPISPPSSPFPSIVRQSVAAIPSPPELRPFFPGLWLAWRYSCVLAWPACLYTGGEGRDWLSQAQSHTLTHPLNKATQQDCFSSLLVGQPFPSAEYACPLDTPCFLLLFC